MWLFVDMNSNVTEKNTVQNIFQSLEMNKVQFSSSSVWILTLMLPVVWISVKQIHGTLPIFTTNFFMIQFNIILSYTHMCGQAHALRFLNVISVFEIFQVKFCVNLLFSKVSCRSCTSQLSLCNHIKNIRWRSQIMQFLSAIISTSQVNMFSSKIQCSWAASIYCLKWNCFHFIFIIKKHTITCEGI